MTGFWDSRDLEPPRRGITEEELRNGAIPDLTGQEADAFLAEHHRSWAAGEYVHPGEDAEDAEDAEGTSGQDRESYTDTQDRDSYLPADDDVTGPGGQTFAEQRREDRRD